MNLMQLAIALSVDDKASAQIAGIAGNVEKGLGKAAAAGKAMLAAGGAATIALGKAALDSYADYEQLTGGIKKLYGDAYDTVAKNAAQAFKTTGMSQNEYMSNATAFSAKLLADFGGDAEKAAAYSDKAMRQIADNANTYGKFSVEELTQVYQALARGSYMTLDNLNLGFSGTKEGMQELLDQAEELTGKHYTLGNFADTVDAIQAVQTHLHITGTTAEEAAHTISGSVGMMKGAWTNWLTGLASDDADMEQLTQDLIDSVGTVFDNAAPRIKEIAETALQAIPEAVGGIVGSIIDPETGQKVEDALNGIGDALVWLKDNADLVVPAVVGVATAIGAFQAITTVTTIINALTAAFAAYKAANEGATVAQWLMNAAMSANPAVIIAAAIIGLIAAIAALYMTNEDFRNGVTAAWEAISSTAQQVFGDFINLVTVDIPNAITGLLNGFTQIPETIGLALAGAITAIATWASSIVTEATTAASGFVMTVVRFFVTLPNRIRVMLLTAIMEISAWAASMAESARTAGSSMLTNVVTFVQQLPGRIGAFLTSALGRLASWAGSAASRAAAAGKAIFTGIVDKVKSIPGKMAEIGKNIADGIKNGIKDNIGKVADTLLGGLKDAVKGAKKFLGIKSPSRLMRDQVGKFISEGLAVGIDVGWSSSDPFAAVRDDVNRNIQDMRSTLTEPLDMNVKTAEMTATSISPEGAELIQRMDSIELWLRQELGDVIEQHAPTATPREFGRMVRSVV